MSIFDRLSRLARAEANHLGNRVRELLEPDGRSRARPGKDPADGIDDGLDEAAAQAPEPPPPPRYSKEIREAYATLELPLGADRARCKKAWRDKLRTHHPDRHQGSEAAEDRANERTLKLNAAWERLDAFLP